MSPQPSFPPLFTGHEAPPGADPMALAIAEAAHGADPGLLVWSPDPERMAAALDLLRGPEKGGAVAIVICDSGLKYLSTDLWE